MGNQVEVPKTAADAAPSPGVVMHPEYAKAIAQVAYVWGWPMVNMLKRSASITKAPQPGDLRARPGAAGQRLLVILDGSWKPPVIRKSQVKARGLDETSQRPRIAS